MSTEQPAPDASRPVLAVLGAGSYGTALAIQLARNGHETWLWGRDTAAMQAMAQARVNARYLPDCPFPDLLKPSSDLSDVIAAARDVIVAVPSHAVRSLLAQIKPMLRDDQQLACAAKGFEHGTGKLMHEVFAEELGADYPMVLVSGPTFAKEVGKGVPTAITIAAASLTMAERIAEYFHGHGFRAYTNDDIIGVEVGGAVKNVLAIGVGAADGMGAGANTRALMITRGLAEIMRLAEALGGQGETLMGLAGLGDLVLTCTDNQSRNRRFGLLMAAGKSREEAIAEIGQVVEGVKVAPEVRRLAQKYQVEMPITEMVYQVLYEGVHIQIAAQVLMQRPVREE